MTSAAAMPATPAFDSAPAYRAAGSDEKTAHRICRHEEAAHRMLSSTRSFERRLARKTRRLTWLTLLMTCASAILGTLTSVFCYYKVMPPSLVLALLGPTFRLTVLLLVLIMWPLLMAIKWLHLSLLEAVQLDGAVLFYQGNEYCDV